MTKDSRCHELPCEQKLDNGRLTTKMAETSFVKLPTLDDNLRKQPNVTDLLIQGDNIAGKVSRDFTCKKSVTRFYVVSYKCLTAKQYCRWLILKLN